MEYDLEFGTVTFDERWTTYRSKASVTCHDGYRIHGEESLTCLASGKWSTLTKCVIHGKYVHLIDKQVATAH